MQPLTRDAVAKSKQDISTALQETLVHKLIEEVNIGIQSSLVQHRDYYRVTIPAVIFGYPVYSAREVATLLKDKYQSSGFTTLLEGRGGNTLVIRW
jgi:hypothetical protein